jgi:N12 class adenine-specific DNA methylase
MENKSNSLKGIGPSREYFLRSMKLNQYYPSLHSPVVYKLFFGSLLKKILNKKDFACFYENTYEY